MLWNEIHQHGHRYNVRAADREAIQVEQRLVRSLYEVPIDATACRQNFNETKIPSKQEAKKIKITSN
uniref:Uncharacterized protein n=1 Tax=Onchocerca volvulus TaxID=6282 RepID=A0A2K6W6R0_ONCVO